MRNYLPSLLLGLLLLVAACGKKKDPEPEPEPPLEGTWTVQRTETTSYNPDGSFFSTTGSKTPSISITYAFTSTQMTIAINGRPTVYDYTRVDRTLTSQEVTNASNRYDQSIEELTTSTLVLKFTVVNQPNNQRNVTVLRLAR